MEWQVPRSCFKARGHVSNKKCRDCGDTKSFEREHATFTTFLNSEASKFRLLCPNHGIPVARICDTQCIMKQTRLQAENIKFDLRTQ